MSLELVGLAYDREQADAFWLSVPAREAYRAILEDEFRGKIDPRSILYHKGHIDLLSEIEHFLKQGGDDVPLVGLLSQRFRAGVEDFPGPAGELALDFKLIRHFTSLAMVDDYLTADRFLRGLLLKVGYLTDGSAWSLVDWRDHVGMAAALRSVRMDDILKAGEAAGADSSPVSFERLVRNYIEFFWYAGNNGLRPFFYNSGSDFRKWGDLAERKHERTETIVDRSMRLDSLSSRRQTPSTRRVAPASSEASPSFGVEQRIKRRRELDSLISGLGDSDPLIRRKAAESLVSLASPEVLPALESLLLDGEPEVRQEIVRAVGAVGDRKSEDVLLRVLAEDDVLTVRLTAAYVLCRLGSKAVVAPLLALIERGQAHFAVLLSFHADLRRNREIPRHLGRLALAENPIARAEAAYLLGRFPKTSAERALSRLSDDPDPQVASNALYSLLKVGSQRASEISRRFSLAAEPQRARAGAVVSSLCRGIGESS